MFLYVLVLCLGVGAESAANEPVVVVPGRGSFKGKMETTESGLDYMAFTRILYAKAPVGSLRFKPPVLPNADEGSAHDVADVTHEEETEPVCPQYSLASDSPIGQENCLFLDVFTRDTRESANVLVYIHGGAFSHGGSPSRLFAPDAFLPHGILLVTLQYRLGPLGWLSLGNETMRGNTGLRDVMLALRWIQDHVKEFGGDPERVTLMGDDAGAAIVSALLFVEDARGLFQSVILLSGNVRCEQYRSLQPQKAAVKLAKRLGCAPARKEEEGNKGEKILGCLRVKKAADIVRKANEMSKFFSFPRMFGMVEDGELLPRDTGEALAKGEFIRVPVLMGQTKDEGAAFYRLIMNSFSTGEAEEDFLEHLPQLLPVLSHYRSQLHTITRAVRNRFFEGMKSGEEEVFRPAFVQFLTDFMFTRCTEEFARGLAAGNATVYAYVFAYEGQQSVVQFQGEDNMGVAHGDDLQYMFEDIWGTQEEMDEFDQQFSEDVFIPLLVNFIKYGVPVKEMSRTFPEPWTPYDPSTKRNYFLIDEQPRMLKSYREDALRFWLEDIPALIKASKEEQKKNKKSKEGRGEECEPSSSEDPDLMKVSKEEQQKGERARGVEGKEESKGQMIKEEL